ncbi:hypothetical protein F4678DRAFT_479175 [Xylaria arbuscula]|nr:hypothetical protein F4678DRAFT_479175 [Xylaria arbuscula]
MSASQGLSGLSLSSYTNDEETFTKLLVPVEQAEKSGQHPRRWAKERIANEVAVLDSGGIDEGTYYIILERIKNAVPLFDLQYECGREGHKAPCKECLDIATENARPYVQHAQNRLAGFNSPASGFNGVVIPPHFVTQTDDRATWGVQYAPRNEKFSLMHGDLRPGNVIIDLTTLEFKAIIDWECAGFYPKWLAESF